MRLQALHLIDFSPLFENLFVARNKFQSKISHDEDYLEIKDECWKRIESLE